MRGKRRKKRKKKKEIQNVGVEWKGCEEAADGLIRKVSALKEAFTLWLIFLR